MKDSLNLVVGHALATLPDSLSQRKALLMALVSMIPRRHPLRAKINSLHLLLESHEEHQLKLSLEFPRLAKPSRDGNGETQTPNS